MSKFRPVITITILTLLTVTYQCAQMQRGPGNSDKLLSRSRHNIFIAQNIEDTKRRSLLLNTALKELQRADTLIKKKKNGPRNRVDAGFALYYAAKRNTAQAKTYIAAARKGGPTDPAITVIDIRIQLQDKGRAYAAQAISGINSVITKLKEKDLARLTLGDSNFLLARYAQAVKYYQGIVLHSKDLQGLAAERLEYIDEIQRARKSPAPFIKKLF